MKKGGNEYIGGSSNAMSPILFVKNKTSSLGLKDQLQTELKLAWLSLADRSSNADRRLQTKISFSPLNLGYGAIH